MTAVSFFNIHKTNSVYWTSKLSSDTNKSSSTLHKPPVIQLFFQVIKRYALGYIRRLYKPQMRFNNHPNIYIILGKKTVKYPGITVNTLFVEFILYYFNLES